MKILIKKGGNAVDTSGIRQLRLVDEGVEFRHVYQRQY